MSDIQSAANEAQIDYWNAAAGHTWASFQIQLDAQLAPLGLAALQALAPVAGERILDIGCGCGDTTLALAQVLGPTGAVVGVDISEPMLAIARARPVPPGYGGIDFRLADAQTTDLGTASFDAAFSRFGVMFFEDPTAAFTNIAKMLRPGGRLGFVCWRPYELNLWMRAPMDAALPFLPPRPPIDPLAPGPFAFADADRVRGILADAGFSDIAIAPFDTDIGESDVETTLQLSLRVGPLGRALQEFPDRADTLKDAVRSALSGFLVADGRVRLPAAVWIVSAKVR